MTPPDSGSPGRLDRRGGDRMDILGDLQGEVMVYQPMTIREISPGGAQIETSFPLQLGSLHDLRLDLAGASVVAQGRVVHCTISDMDREIVTYRSGLEFVRPGSRVSEAIERFIAAVKSARLAG